MVKKKEKIKKPQRSYGRNFRKNKQGRWVNKKTGRLTNVRKLRGAKSMAARHGGTLTSWEKKLSKHYTELKAWQRGDRFTEPILEYE